MSCVVKGFMVRGFGSRNLGPNFLINPLVLGFAALNYIPCCPLATPRRMSSRPSEDEGGGGMTVVDEGSGGAGGGGGGTEGDKRPVRGKVTLSG